MAQDDEEEDYIAAAIAKMNKKLDANMAERKLQEQ